MKLRANQRCWIHKSLTCCGRSESKPSASKWEAVPGKAGWRRLKDEHSGTPDGYRYKLSPAAMRSVLEQKVIQQNGLCAYCGKAFADMREVTPDHVGPKGMGGGRGNDHPDNIVASCGPCNLAKGSRRL